MARGAFAKVEMEVPKGAQLCGYGPYLGRIWKRAHDPLYARALAIEADDGSCVLILQLDLPAVSQDVVSDCLWAASVATQLPAERMLLTCSHTHSGPAVLPTLGYGEQDASFVSSLPEICAGLADRVLSALRPIRLGMGRAQLMSAGFNRVRETGPHFSSLDVLRIDDVDARPHAVAYSFACHPVTIDVRGAAGSDVSADYPGWVAKRISSDMGAEAMFLLGPCGDIDPVVAWRRFEYQGLELTGELVAQALLRVARDVRTDSNLELQIVRRSFELPLRPLSDIEIDAALLAGRQRISQLSVDERVHESGWKRFWSEWESALRRQVHRQPSPLSVELAVLQLNDAAWVFLPGEVFCSLGQEIRERSPFGFTALVTLLGGYVGYIPDAQEMAAGGYAAAEVPRVLARPPFQPDVGRRVVDEALRALATPEHRSRSKRPSAD